MAVIRLPESTVSSICDITEKWAYWDCGANISGALVGIVSWMKQVTLNGVHRRPALSTDFRERIAITRT